MDPVQAAFELRIVALEKRADGLESELARYKRIEEARARVVRSDGKDRSLVGRAKAIVNELQSFVGQSEGELTELKKARALLESENEASS